MVKTVVLPKVCEDMENGVIVALNKAVGDSFEEGEALFAAEVKKVVFEVEACGNGVVTALFCSEGRTVQAGAAVMQVRL